MPQESFAEPALARPSWLLVINSLFVTAAFLFLGGFWAANLWNWEVVVSLFAVICVAPSFLIARWQYNATFRANPRAAARASVWLLLCGGLLMVFAGIGITPGSIFWVGGAWLLFSAILAHCWWDRMAKSFAVATSLSRATPPPVPANWGISGGRVTADAALRGLLRFAAAASIAAGGFAFGMHEIGPQRQMHVSPAAAGFKLPAGATDLCVAHGQRGNIAYDFAIDEAGFWKWVESNPGSFESETDHVPIKKVEQSFAIYSCQGDFDGNWGEHVIHHGWYYDWHKGDAGWQYAYDADNGRAYCNVHSF